MSLQARKIWYLAVAAILTLALAWAFWSFLNGEVVFNLIFNDPAAFREYLAGNQDPGQESLTRARNFAII